MKINLLPREKAKKKSPYLEQGVFALVLIGLVFIILIGIKVYIQRSAEALDKKILDTKNELQKLKKDEEKIAELKKNIVVLEQKVKVIEQLENNKSGPAKILAGISMTIVSGKMWLTNLRCQGSTLTMDGIAADNETIAQFMTNLEDSPEFENVELRVAEGNRIESYVFKKFTLTSTITAKMNLEKTEKPLEKGGAGAKKA